MKKTFFALAFYFISVITVWAQNPTPTPTSDEDDVVKITTTLIQVDVSVTNKDGKQVTDLKPEDFEILENGEAQNITNFSYVAVTPDVRSQTQTQNQITSNSKQIIVPPIPTNLRPEQVRRTIVLVVDDLQMTFGSMFAVRDALKKFVEEQMQEGDLVAIFRTSTGISALQQFTSDKRVLRAAIEKVKWNPFTGTINVFDPINPSIKDYINGQVSQGGVANVQGDAQDKAAERQINEARQGIFVAGTLGAMRYIVRGMGELPGRKAIVLFSDGFKIFERDIKERKSNVAIVQQAMENLVEAANRAGVVINTIDARGLVVDGMFTSQDNTLGKSLEELEGIQQQRINDFRDSQEGLSYLADQTGGRTFKNNNGISDAVKKILNDQNGYYLIGYQPDTETFDATKRKFNKLVVRVKRDGVKVKYRSGFFGITDEQIRPTVQTAQQKTLDALFSPFKANGINMRMTSIFANNAKEGNYVRALLHIDSKSIKFTDEANGNKKASFEVIAYTFGESGNVVDNFAKSYVLSVKPEEMKRVIEKGLIYSMVVPIKKAGAYQLRVAIRDTQSDNVGSANQFIEVPNLDKKNLALSGIILQNLTIEQWKTIENSSTSDAVQVKAGIIDAQTTTATRIFRRGTILFYNYVVYNAKTSGNQVQMQTQARLYRDGQLVFEGKLAPLNTAGQTDLKRIEGDGAISLGKNLAVGDYVLQIIAVDGLAKEKNQIQAQFIDFELID